MQRASFLFAAVCLLAACNLTLAVAQDASQYKVGDRVLVTPTGLQADKYWQTCTVTFPLHLNGIGVKCDPQYGGTPIDYNVMPKWIKPFGAGDPRNAKATYETQPSHEAADHTVLPDRPLVDCNVDQPATSRNGDHIPPALAKRLIQCLWERPAAQGMDGAITIDVDSMTIGAPRKWVYQHDMGQGIADLNTLVWPIDVKWTWKTYFRTRTHVIVREDIFNCYVNAFRKWTCGAGQGIRAILTKDITVQ